MRLNTDAIDNSAGVNTSDVEVNIKIALSLPVRDGRLTIKARNTLLAEMTDEVAALVLRNNYLQTLALSLAERRGLEDLGFQQRLMQTLEAARRARPRGRVPAGRHGDCRARPPLAAADAAGAGGAARLRQAVALCGLLDSTVPDDPYLGRELGRYFPKVIAREISRRAGAAPAAPRDHRDAACQLDDQPRRAVAGGADRRPDRRSAAPISPRRSRRCATATTCRR